MRVREMSIAKDLFFTALEDIRFHYSEYQFMVNRDLTWILQKKINQMIEEEGLPFELYQDFPLEKGCRERKEHELVLVPQGTNYRDIFSLKSKAELVIRILFEPSKKRNDVCDHHLPRVLITQLMHDIEKVQLVTQKGQSQESVCLLIDEYSRHRHQVIQNEHIIWKLWGSYDDPGLNVSVLIAQY